MRCIINNKRNCDYWIKFIQENLSRRLVIPVKAEFLKYIYIFLYLTIKYILKNIYILVHERNWVGIDATT